MGRSDRCFPAAGLRRLCWSALGLLFGLLGYFTAAGWLAPGELAVPAQAAAPLVPICALQGNSFVSPYSGQTVRTQGLVIADLDETARRGLFIQAPGCDPDPATSDAVFVSLAASAENVAAAGDLVEVEGLVQENYGLTELLASAAGVRLLARGQPLPEPLDLAPPFEYRAARWYFEARESMLAGLGQAVVVGPTGTSGQTWLIRGDLGFSRVFYDDPAGTAGIVCVDDGGLAEITPQAMVGDRATGLLGVIDYVLGTYCLQLTTRPTMAPQPPPLPPEAPAPGPGLFTLATYNLANLFDTFNDPAVDDTVLSAAEYQRRLQKHALLIGAALHQPDLLAVQEAENRAVLQALASRPEIAASYGIVWQDSPDRRGMDMAILYRLDRVTLLGYQVRQWCTPLVDGLGPDGNQDPINPANAVTCDTDGDGILDGNRMFSRPPLVAHFRLCSGGDSQGCSDGAAGELWVIANHFKSKVEDTATTAYTLPRRVQQAQFTAALVDELRRAQPGANVAVLGDLNDHPDSQPLAALVTAGLDDSLLPAARAERYTYIYEGVSQVLDYILVDIQSGLIATPAQPIHMNADYPADYANVGSSAYRSSDHDPVLIGLVLAPWRGFLPLVTK